MKSCRILFICLLLLLPAAGHSELALPETLPQGALLRLQVTPGTRVYYGEQAIKLNSQGEFIIGFGRDALPAQSLTLITPSGDTLIKELNINQRSYDVERINGISKKMMAPSENDLKRIRKEASKAYQARMVDSELQHFKEEFIWPVTGRISGVYGSQRILNGEPRRPHYGVDIAAKTGTPVIAPAGGQVRLAHPGMFFSGKTLIIDHGHGLSSSFLHLDRIFVKTGQIVSKGDKIATVGATGRVTGPHLDWRVNWFEERLDPTLLVPSMSENQ